MMRQLLVDDVCGRKRIAVLDDGVLCEMHYSSSKSESLSGNIYTGRVMNVLPGMNAAFVDIGIGKNAFLHAGDIKVDLREDKELAGKMDGMSIERIVKPGQEIMVQVVREPGGTKGPRVSSHITLPGKTVVLLPTIKYIGVSHKIDADTERARLRKLAEVLLREYGIGVILRTAAADISEEEISEEYRELVEKWEYLKNSGSIRRAPALIYGGDTLEKVIARDWIETADKVSTDSKEVYEALVKECMGASSKISLHSGNVPLFDVYGIDTEYEKALRHHIWLKSGGYLVIDHTEALTVIDVNTGKYVGKKSHEDTIYTTNCEAVNEIARQLRIRDIGGIVIIDFIDMAEETRREALLDMLRHVVTNDRNKVNVVGMTGLGLVELTRKKSRLSAEKIHNRACNNCGGTGIVEDYETVAWRIVYDLRRRSKTFAEQAYNVKVSGNVAGALISIGAPAGMKVHVETADIPDNEYVIEPISSDVLKSGIKLLRS